LWFNLRPCISNYAAPMTGWLANWKEHRSKLS